MVINTATWTIFPRSLQHALPTVAKMSVKAGCQSKTSTCCYRRWNANALRQHFFTADHHQSSDPESEHLPFPDRSKIEPLSSAPWTGSVLHRFGSIVETPPAIGTAHRCSPFLLVVLDSEECGTVQNGRWGRSRRGGGESVWPLFVTTFEPLRSAFLLPFAHHRFPCTCPKR